MKIFAISVFFRLCFAAGYRYLSASAPKFVKQAMEMQNDPARRPAAIRRDLDFSELSDLELSSAAQNRLMSAAQVIRTVDGQIGLSMGHFATRDAQGRRVLACEFYRRVRLKFEAEGVSEGGEKPTFIITALCEPDKDLAHIKPVFIPISDIWNQKPTNGEMQDIAGAHITFENIPSAWPERWVLTGVRLDQGDGRAQGPGVLVIDEASIRQWRKKSGILDFTVRMPASK